MSPRCSNTVVYPVSPRLLTLRGICSPHLVQLRTVSRTQLTVDLPENLALALGKRRINCAEVGTFHVWKFFEVSIPPVPLIPPFLSPLCHPLFLSPCLSLCLFFCLSSSLSALFRLVSEPANLLRIREGNVSANFSV